jgi:hypothetical protein
MLASMSKAISAAGVNIGTCFLLIKQVKQVKHVQGYLCGGREYRYLLFTCFTCFTGTKLDTLRMGFGLQLECMPATRAQVCNYSTSLHLDELLALLVQNYKH